jgi:hypothetical protein
VKHSETPGFLDSTSLHPGYLAIDSAIITLCALATDPRDPDTVFVIPEESQHMRTSVEDRLRVYRSRNGGADWEPLSRGLPQAHIYVTVLREAMTADGLDPGGVYSRILSVQAAVITHV